MTPIRKELFSCGLAIVLTLLLLAWALELWRADPTIPFLYSGDGVFYLMLFRTTTEHTWYLHNPYLGTPAGLDLHDFPFTDGSNFILLKIIHVFTGNYVVTYNAYFVTGFILTTLSALYAFRYLGVSGPMALVCSLLFSSLPYHFFRGLPHPFLGAYYVIPLLGTIVLEIYSDPPVFFQASPQDPLRLVWTVRQRKALLCALGCLVIGSTYVYYPYFACFFLVVAGLTRFAETRNRQVLVSCLILVSLISLATAVNLVPSFLYDHAHGRNEVAARRTPAEAEAWGLKVTQLILPINNHRFPPFRAVAGRYHDPEVALQDESGGTSLGLIAGLGFVGLLAIALRRPWEAIPSNYKRLATLNLSAVLLGTVGGFGATMALLVSPQVRAYNRISIFIGWFSLVAVALALDFGLKRVVSSSRRSVVGVGALAMLLVVGLLDQTTPAVVPPYATIKEDYMNDHRFVQAIEERLPRQAMIFQLPIMPFPEHGPVHAMPDYDLLKGYLHSSSLRWSYAAMKGRDADWQQVLTSDPIDTLLGKIAAVGFDGIWIDRSGFPDNGRQLMVMLGEKLSVRPLISDNGRLLFFDMRQFSATLRTRYSPEAIHAYAERTLHPIAVTWGRGFYGLETSPARTWRWSSRESEMVIRNSGSGDRIVRILMELRSGWPETSRLRVEGDIWRESLMISSTPTQVVRTVVIPPGKSVVRFESDARQVAAVGDTRSMFFAVANFELQEDGAMLAGGYAPPDSPFGVDSIYQADTIEPR